MDVNLNAQFKEGGRADGAKLESSWRSTCPTLTGNYSALCAFLTSLKAACTADGTIDPNTLTINAAVTLFQTESNVDKVVAKW